MQIGDIAHPQAVPGIFISIGRTYPFKGGSYLSSFFEFS